ncbi:aminomethyl-transferring glycine dehydrogenase [Thermomonas sp.]|uniref:aminomethyl-transferring glycine dehydrogenase n=1 Tax=Thermomonas sp. TaxID=1971895 RepID=UPI001B6CBD3F|nr:aminomethyl-transferring glycine dehydrogenase [Thermomonas sp.]MBK6416312.1 aminomethyl-transferring glycine dehydrogenase [Thermomonas sp.]MBK7205592.1 aminomethyl-transferring glycine dehydrogenase [Thermomonas sp.]MBK9670627.1 aminomethyl-transferring glycine dehydrogenase [Thermomonas sp.]MBL0227737.1 aminomethyl-transferring glycine dehydrogenase [Thermomonas sp.]MBP6438640.1 aminomethyl-transferring glycine dehydrogenase [Thermomonas sp.]
MSTLRSLEHHDAFIERHIGPNDGEIAAMLQVVGHDSLEALTDAIVPASIKSAAPLALPDAVGEVEALARIRAIAAKNQVFRSFIGQGYYGTHVPNVILRNILENPAWYTAYTPYQAEISQGRMEALINFQTMCADLTGMDIANASLLDEATAAAEAMTLARRSAKSKSGTFLVAGDTHPQTLALLQTRAEPLGITVAVVRSTEAFHQALAAGDYFGVLVQYPASSGWIADWDQDAGVIHSHNALFVVATDLLALTLLKPPGEMGADIVIGNTQRFGVPFGFGGPHAAFMACRDAYKRSMPGRLIGVSIDAEGKPAYRLTLQTREQHIRREKATSNICTAQVLLAVMASMYAVYHGPEGLTRIASRVARMTAILAAGLRQLGHEAVHDTAFDTLCIDAGDRGPAILERARAHRANLRVRGNGSLCISLDETTTRADLELLWTIFAGEGEALPSIDALDASAPSLIPQALRRTSRYLTHPVFNTHHSEHELLRYMRSLADKDLAMDRTMIPLGSCTMKLNATAEMIPVTWPEFGDIHPLAPADQAAGYQDLIAGLEAMLVECTGYDAVSLQPNSGAQGEYAGLLAIRAYHASRGDTRRDICLIPESAHGTNPASAQMCGMQVVVTKCDANGNVDVEDIRRNAEKYSDRLAALMITYPSTHGVFEEDVVEICDIVHRHGGQVYTDGANMNALVGVAKPGKWGSDVSHLNLHKTFCIPHGGGGPGVGPCAVKAHLAPFLPKAFGEGGLRTGGTGNGPQVSAASFGSASILPISWMYIAMMGANGLRKATQVALLSANYIAKRLAPHYGTLYTGRNGLVAHECILDLRPLKDATGISAEDVAKRLVDFGFHAPTLSFPVAGTLMVEPTESESLHELDRFIDAMIQIREEIRMVERGELDREDNPLKHAPHTATQAAAAEWNHGYSRELAVFPLASLKQQKYWPPVARVDNVYGDKNVFCACVPIGDFKGEPEAFSEPMAV